MLLIPRAIKGNPTKDVFANVIYTSDKTDLRVQDLASLLFYYTNKQISVVDPAPNTSVPGIHLVKEPLMENGQKFGLEINGFDTAIIYYSDFRSTAGYNTSLSNGITELMYRLGFDFLMAGVDGMHIPDYLNFQILPKTYINPSFRNRNEFGTGGLNATFGDPSIETYSSQTLTSNFSGHWNAFKRWLRFGYDFTVQGHAGGDFYTTMKVRCDANSDEYGYDSPESWFNSESGKKAGRLRIEVPEAVDCYRDYIIAKSQALINAGYSFITVGADPADGRGGADDPLPPSGYTMPDGIQIYNYSDKWMWLANEMSKLWPENGGIKISVQAYGNGPTAALAPNFTMRNNVEVNLNAWAFQGAYFPRETMFPAWKPHATDSSTYEYINITQWSSGKPQFPVLDSIKNKLIIYQNNNVTGSMWETTDANLIAHLHYINARLLFDSSLNPSDLYLEWLDKMFGPAKHVMKGMFDRWVSFKGKGELGHALEDLQTASDLVNKNGLYWKRIAKYKAYVHYLILLYNHDGTTESRDIIIRYMYKIWQHMMIQGPAFLFRDYITPGGSAPSSSGITPMTYPEIEAQFQQDIIDQPSLFEYVDFELDIQKAIYTDPIPNNSWRFGRTKILVQFYPQGDTISFYAGIEDDNAVMTLYNDMDSTPIIQESVGTANYDITETIDTRTWYLKQFTAQVVPGAKYFIKFGASGFNRVKFINPELAWINGAFTSVFDNYQFPPMFIWVPQNATQIVVDSLSGWSARANMDSVNINATLFDGETRIRYVDVPENRRGMCWRLQFVETSPNILNLPRIVSLQPFDYPE